MVDVLAIGAHMGDEVAWGMALAALKRQGASIGLLHLTPGEKGHKTMPPEEYARQKRAEAEECARELGAEMWELDYRDGELPVNDEAKHRIAKVLREARPRLVITHWGSSIHKDHATANELLPDARFYDGLPAFASDLPAHWVPRVLYGENWEDSRGFQPEVFLELIEEDLEVWERAMRRYALFRGEVSPFRYIEYYRALAKARGLEVMREFACAFAVPPDQRPRVVRSLLD